MGRSSLIGFLTSCISVSLTGCLAVLKFVPLELASTLSLEPLLG